MLKEVLCNFPLCYVIMIIMGLLVFSHTMSQKMEEKLQQATFNLLCILLSWLLHVRYSMK